MQIVFYTIYKTTNKINGKIYIGKHQTKDPNDTYLGSGKLLWNSINKYGIENFEKEILFVFDTEAEMNNKESELVTDEFVLESTNYNLCPGGQGGWGYLNSNGLNRTEWHKENNISHMKKMSKQGNAKKKILLETDKEWKEQYSKSRSESAKRQFITHGNPFEGKTHTDETKAIIGMKNSIRQSGNGNSQYCKMWITNGNDSMRIMKTDNIPEGWYKGRKIKNI